jgi:hypothetical protein
MEVGPSTGFWARASNGDKITAKSMIKLFFILMILTDDKMFGIAVDKTAVHYKIETAIGEDSYMVHVGDHQFHPASFSNEAHGSDAGNCICISPGICSE